MAELEKVGDTSLGRIEPGVPMFTEWGAVVSAGGEERTVLVGTDAVNERLRVEPIQVAGVNVPSKMVPSLGGIAVIAVAMLAGASQSIVWGVVALLFTLGMAVTFAARGDSKPDVLDADHCHRLVPGGHLSDLLEWESSGRDHGVVAKALGSGTTPEVLESPEAAEVLRNCARALELSKDTPAAPSTRAGVEDLLTGMTVEDAVAARTELSALVEKLAEARDAKRENIGSGRFTPALADAETEVAVHRGVRAELGME